MRYALIVLFFALINSCSKNEDGVYINDQLLHNLTTTETIRIKTKPFTVSDGFEIGTVESVYTCGISVDELLETPIYIDSDQVRLERVNIVNHLILKTFDPINNHPLAIISYINCKVLGVNYVGSSNFKDFDNDGFVEVGAKKYTEVYCEDCDITYYDPIIMYELGLVFQLDTVLSRTMTTDAYGVFLGYEVKDTILYFD